MKKIKTILSVLVISLLFTACKKESLQSYLVESQDKKGYVTVDIPASIIKISSGQNVSDDVKETIESIRKVNIVALPYKGNEDAYDTEKDKLKRILGNSSEYKSLMSMKDKRGNMKIYYSGDTDAIDEVIAFGYSKKAGVGIARILGDDMNPGKIMEAMKYIKVDGDDVNLSQFKVLMESN